MHQVPGFWPVDLTRMFPLDPDKLQSDQLQHEQNIASRESDASGTGILASGFNQVVLSGS